MDLGRLHPNIAVRHMSPNWSLRHGKIGLIVLHDTEAHNTPGSPRDLEALGNWFGQSASQVSCHVGTDVNGDSGVYVDSARKAWHVAEYNSAAVGIEQVGFSVDDSKAWQQRPLQLAETARWIARWSDMYDIPIQHASVAWGGVMVPGVITHRELGALGGNHNDPGPGYPFWHVLHLAEMYKRALRGLPVA